MRIQLCFVSESKQISSSSYELKSETAVQVSHFHSFLIGKAIHIQSQSLKYKSQFLDILVCSLAYLYVLEKVGGLVSSRGFRVLIPEFGTNLPFSQPLSSFQFFPRCLWQYIKSVENSSGSAP